MVEPQEDRHTIGDLGNFGLFMWEAASKFQYVKLATQDSVMGKGLVTVQFGMQHKGKALVHNEMFTIDMIESMTDPRVVVDAIHSRMLKY